MSLRDSKQHADSAILVEAVAQCVGIRMDFIAGQFHTMPWKRPTQDGEIEWPPAPWRLLRAIIFGWQRNQVEDANVLMRLCDALAEPPRYLLPPVVTDHSQKSIILDSNVPFDHEPDKNYMTTAFIVWDHLSLDDQMHHLLVEACRQVLYLGHAKTWCRLEVIMELPSDLAHIEVDLASHKKSNGPVIKRLGVDPAMRNNGLLRALCETKSDVYHPKQGAPVGSIWFEYAFPTNFGFGPSLWQEPSAEAAKLPQLERFAITPWHSNDGLPSITETIHIASLLRNAAMTHWTASHSGRPATTLFTGRVNDELVKGHGHAYYLPRDLDNDGFIDHIDIRLPFGAYAKEIDAIRAIQQLSGQALGDAKYRLTSLGEAVFDEGTHWISCTPFIPSVYAKKHVLRGGAEAMREWVAEQVQRELTFHHYPAPVAVIVGKERIPALRHTNGRQTRFDEFKQQRKPSDRAALGFHVAVEFSEPQIGPISLGRAAHYGLGMFGAAAGDAHL